jgi:hypothetical protein
VGRNAPRSPGATSWKASQAVSSSQQARRTK